MALQKFSVCYHCKNRTIGCHGSCKEYLEEKAENEKAKKQSIEKALINETLCNLHHHRNKSIKDLRHLK